MRDYIDTHSSDTHVCEIFIAGDKNRAKNICLEYCTKVGLCVTVDPTTYVYSGGQEDGVRIGLRNYPRFPEDGSQLHVHAFTLARKLILGLYQGSCMIVEATRTFWLTRRDGD